MAATISTLTPALKEVFAQEEVTKQFDEGTLLMDIIEKGDQNAPQFVEMEGKSDGKYVIFPLHTSGNPNVGIGVSEGDQYPKAGQQTYAQAKFRNRYVTSAMELTTQAMSRTAGTEQAIFQAAAAEASKLVGNTKRRMNQWLHRDGSGLLASVVSYSGSTYTVDSSADVPVGAEIIVREKATGGWSAGTTPDWSATSGVKDPAYVASKTANTIVLTQKDESTAWSTAGANSTNTMGVYYWDSQGNLPYGLDNVCSTLNPPYAGFDHTNSTLSLAATDDGGLNACFGAIDRVTGNDFWKALNSTDDGIVTALSAAPSIEEHIQPLINAINIADSTLIDEDAIVCVSRQAQWWSIVNQLETGKRTEVRTRIIDGKYEVVRYGPITFCYDGQSTANTMKFFAPRYMFRMVLTPWGFEDMATEWTQVLGAHNRPIGKWRKNLYTEQQLCANYCGANCTFTNVS